MNSLVKNGNQYPPTTKKSMRIPNTGERYLEKEFLNDLGKLIGVEMIDEVSYTTTFMTVCTHLRQGDSTTLLNKKLDAIGAEILQIDDKVFIRRKRPNAIPLGLKGLYLIIFSFVFGFLLWYYDEPVTLIMTSYYFL